MASPPSPGSSSSPLELPDLIYPPLPWALQKAPPKASLSPIQARQARPLVLNLVEAIHWVSFPLSF